MVLISKRDTFSQRPDVYEMFNPAQVILLEDYPYCTCAEATLNQIVCE